MNDDSFTVSKVFSMFKKLITLGVEIGKKQINSMLKYSLLAMDNELPCQVNDDVDLIRSLCKFIEVLNQKFPGIIPARKYREFLSSVQ